MGTKERESVLSIYTSHIPRTRGRETRSLKRSFALQVVAGSDPTKESCSLLLAGCGPESAHVAMLWRLGNVSDTLLKLSDPEFTVPERAAPSRVAVHAVGATKLVVCIGEYMVEFLRQGDGLWHLGFADDSLNVAWPKLRATRRSIG